MAKFSQRQGLVPTKSIVQFSEVDNALRIALWNVLTIYLWADIDQWISNYPEKQTLLKKIWIHHLNRSLDTLNDCWPMTHKSLDEYFFKCKWYEVYDFIEFIGLNYSQSKEQYSAFINFCNSMLERECSAYRFVSGEITQITSEIEIDEIEEALSNFSPLDPVQTHLRAALTLLSDRSNPDYRNSIKESISAVESLARLITEDSKATLGQALKTLESKIEIHSALKDSFAKVYGYTSDEGGIRHALTTESNLDFDDAKYMLVTCSAFTNYLIAKAEKSGIQFQSGSL